MSDSQLVFCETAEEYHALLMQGLFPIRGPIRLPDWIPHDRITGDLIESTLNLPEFETEEELLAAIQSHCQEQPYPMVVEYGGYALPGFGSRCWIIRHALSDIPTVKALFGLYGVTQP